ncbi:protein gamma response 1 [Papilio machaon]|uniref:protein gamma response 1 n=1 Tax=Papilio machaon TaxID=76193 RepID=UPI001E665F1F|nr:protein gamma response 1 [Papilio machaon]
MTNETKLFENFSILCTNPKVQALETTLLQSFANFKDILLEYEEIVSELESYKSQIFIQKEKCESKSCTSSESLKQIINEKDKMIQSIANILLEINETKNLDIITDALKIISGEISPLSQKSSSEALSPVFEPSSIYDKISSNFDKKFTSTPEVDSIPSGRKSPIIETKKFRITPDVAVENVVQEKKKCPEIWPTPEKKMLKLVFPTPGKSKSNVKLRQARLNFVKEKATTVVDLTCSPKESDYSSNSMSQGIKKEVFENDDTILPSPTSGPINFSSVYKSICKSSPKKAKKSLSLNKLITNKEIIWDNKENKSIKVEDRTEDDFEESNVLKESNKSNTTPKKFNTPLSKFKLKTECTTFVDENDENLSKEVTIDKDIEESINILRHYPERFTKSPSKPQSPMLNLQSQEANESISLLQRINQFDKKQDGGQPCSPTKRPSSPSDIQASLSVLNNNFNTKVSNKDSKRTKPIPVEPIFKEPTVRKKAEKLALPGWSCDECKQFYDELYKDNPEMLRQKMSECSRHRGRRDPARPRTPPGYWQPRWHVPNDTDEFNRLNNAI